MLVLSRKRGEGIQIGDQIMIRVVEIRGNRVRIAIDAPGDVGVLREELVFDTGSLAELCPQPAVAAAS